MKIIFSLFLLIGSVFLGSLVIADDYSSEYENHNIQELKEEYERIHNFASDFYFARDGSLQELMESTEKDDIYFWAVRYKENQGIIDNINSRKKALSAAADKIRESYTPAPTAGPPPTPKGSVQLQRISIYNAVAGQTDSSPCYGPKGKSGQNFCSWSKADSSVRLLAISPDLRAWGNGWGSFKLGDKVQISGASHSYCNGTFIVADATNSRYRKTADILSWRTTGLCKYGILQKL